MKPPAWRCGLCKQMQKPYADFCQSCGGKWDQVGDLDYNPASSSRQENRPSHGSKYQADQWDYGWQDWASWEQGQWPNTPRHRREPSRSQPRAPSQSRQEGKKGKGKAKGKGKGKKGPVVEPIWHPETPPTPAPKPSPPQATSMAPEATQLAKLLHALKSNGETLSPEIKEIMKEVDLGDVHASKKHLHHVVNQISDARRRMTETSSARAQLHLAWKAFLTDAVDRWDQYMKDFAEQDNNMAAQFAKATQDWEEAKANFKVTKKSLNAEKEDKEAKDGEEDAQEISDMEDTESKTEEDTKIKEGIGHMSNALRELKTQAEAIAAESSQVKKQRLADGTGRGSGPPLLGKRVLQPFWTADS